MSSVSDTQSRLGNDVPWSSTLQSCLPTSMPSWPRPSALDTHGRVRVRVLVFWWILAPRQAIFSDCANDSLHQYLFVYHFRVTQVLSIRREASLRVSTGLHMTDLRKLPVHTCPDFVHIPHASVVSFVSMAHASRLHACHVYTICLLIDVSFLTNVCVSLRFDVIFAFLLVTFLYLCFTFLFGFGFMVCVSFAIVLV